MLLGNCTCTDVDGHCVVSRFKAMDDGKEESSVRESRVACLSRPSARASLPCEAMQCRTWRSL